MSITGFNRRRRELALKEKEEAEKVDVEEPIEDVENSDTEDLTKLKVDELKAIAKEKGLEGYSSLTKTELIKLIEV
ncbi:MAG: Rho termination factor N-terminal domain-containing protein [Paraclostridium bifermentans]|uniref:Rho termination factor N-terminal domain-containing protein n=1 Tax=Paraclostridium bifermentans TaxID=1490 RepID=UPI001D1C802B|nr:Rho termination factor N-terminal domain-containing protein [Paraclostridium bifermentans]MBS6509746.1 Rho termination factor N-terminal domain-containing protein [Paraclostridium bifermentans]MDU3801854.1 Rho termination factor N-terminal domain-containing protein [Paraclostridium bifermentans]